MGFSPKHKGKNGLDEISRYLFLALSDVDPIGPSV